MPARRAAVLQLIRAMAMADAPSPAYVGVDYWAMRKGCRYGTIVADLERLDAGAGSRTRWRAIYDEVRHQRAGGETLLGITRAMGLARPTAHKYAAADTFPARLPHGAGPSLLDAHMSYLVRRIGDGCENAMVLWREVKESEYPGTSRQVHRFVAGLWTNPTRSGRKPQHKTPAMPEQPAAGSPLATARQLAWLLVQPITALDAAAAAVVTYVEQDETAKAVAGLARRFTALVGASGLIEMANGVRDGAADLVVEP